MPDGQAMGKAIVAAGYAINHDGGRRRGWCRYGRWAPLGKQFKDAYSHSAAKLASPRYSNLQRDARQRIHSSL